MTTKICADFTHVPMKVDRAHKPGILICEVCGKKLRKEKKPEPKPKNRQEELWT
jgi:hypothetical protein